MVWAVTWYVQWRTLTSLLCQASSLPWAPLPTPQWRGLSEPLLWVDCTAGPAAPVVKMWNKALALQYNSWCHQEAAWSITFGRHASKLIENYIFGILTSRAINWYIYGSNRGRGGGGGPGGVLVSLVQIFSGPLPRSSDISSESSAQVQLIGTLLEQIG